jgi:hypothetical protein
MRYQTGHKSFAGFKYDAALTSNKSTMYHPNFMKGSEAKVEALQRYGRWAIATPESMKTPGLQTLECV